MDLNLVVLAGRLAAPPELRHFDSGTDLVRYLVTVRSDKPQRRVDVVPVTKRTTGGEEPELLGDPGKRIFVAGGIHRTFGTGASTGRSRLEVVARHVELRDEWETETFTRP